MTRHRLCTDLSSHVIPVFLRSLLHQAFGTKTTDENSMEPVSGTSLNEKPKETTIFVERTAEWNYTLSLHDDERNYTLENKTSPLFDRKNSVTHFHNHIRDSCTLYKTNKRINMLHIGVAFINQKQLDKNIGPPLYTVHFCPTQVNNVDLFTTMRWKSNTDHTTNYQQQYYFKYFQTDYIKIPSTRTRQINSMAPFLNHIQDCCSVV